MLNIKVAINIKIIYIYNKYAYRFSRSHKTGSEFQSVLTMLLNELIVALLIHLYLRILIRGPRLLVE